MKFSTICKPIELVNNVHEYPFPNTPCGILPFYLNEANQIVWGCVESNRVGPIVVAPPAGTQDAIIKKDMQTFKLENAKPIPNTAPDFLSKFYDLPFKEPHYQKVIQSLLDNNYKVYIESPFTTALHETEEEFGLAVQIDKDKIIGKDAHKIRTILDIPEQEIQAKRGTTTQKVYLAYLENNKDILLKETHKIEEKIALTKGREFYEKGTWQTLEEVKALLKKQQDIYSNQTHLSTLEALTVAEVKAFASRVELLERLESSAVVYLNSIGIYPISLTDATAIPYMIITFNENLKSNNTPSMTGIFATSKISSAGTNQTTASLALNRQNN